MVEKLIDSNSVPSKIRMCNFSIHLDRSNTVDHEFIEQCKWFGLSSAVYSCLFLMCATDIYFYLMFYV